MGSIQPKRKLAGIIIPVMILIIGIILFLGIRNGKLPDHPENVTERPDISIETPYCTLYYPSKWESNVIIKTTADVVGFYASIDKAELHLFDICFGSMDGERLGKVLCKDGSEVDVFLKVFPITLDVSWRQDIVDAVYAMQEDVNHVIERISFLKEITAETGLEAVATETVATEYEDLVFDFPYGKLYFPGQWKDYVRFEYHEGAEITAVLYGTIGDHPDIALFQMVFGSPSSNCEGIFTTTEGKKFGVSLILNELELDDTWNQEQQQILLSMQESVNHMLEKMSLTVEELDAVEETVPPDEDEVTQDILVETPYVQLKYPGKWKKQIRVEQIDGEVYTVVFYGTASSSYEMYLFSIRFNDPGSEPIGVLKTSEGIDIPMSVVVEDLLFDPETDQETMDVYYAMLDDVNYLISQLPLE